MPGSAVLIANVVLTVLLLYLFAVCVLEAGNCGHAVLECPANCYGRGVCARGQCVCSAGFHGSDCSLPACPAQCSQNGVCIDGICVCKPRYTGPDCSVDRLDAELTRLLDGLALDLDLKGRAQCEFITRSGVDLNGGGQISFFNDKSKTLESYEVPTAMQDVLPASCPSKRFKRCAIVGNSGTLRFAELGAEIDAHDMVYRFNQAPTQGFERHVGQRTTYESLNSKFAHMIVQDDPSWRWRASDTSYLFFEPIKLRDTYVKIRNKFNEVGAFMFSPEFFVRAHTVYDQLQNNLERARVGCFAGEKPMSGFYATMFTLGVCDEVNAYGFDPWTDDMSGKFKTRYHYFDSDEPRPGAHSFDASFYMYRLLELSGKYNFRLHLISVPPDADFGSRSG